jgi:4-amino-4-deoxy-L-arabinose transferase-like glycosyltransferase
MLLIHPHKRIIKFLQSYAFIFLIALLVRLLFLWQIKDGPFFPLLLGDAESYDTWAREIASGNYFGNIVFYQTPFYPYFLGLIYTVFGRDLLILRLIQATVGAFSCLLVAKAGGKIFSHRSGYIAGILLTFYPVAIIFDLMIQKAVLGLFFQALMLFCLSKIILEKKIPLRWSWFTGITIGCFCLNRENAQIYIPLMLLWFGYHGFHRPLSRNFAPVICFILGLATVFVPVALRNKIVGDEFILTTSQLGSNFYIGNNKASTGLYQPLIKDRGDWKFERIDATQIAEEKVGHQLTPREVSRFWLKQTFLEISEEPFRWLKLLAKKWFLFFNSIEFPDTDDPMMFLEGALLMQFLWYLYHFGVLIPLAAGGIYFTKDKWKRLWPLYAMVFAYAASVTLFFLFSRYRLPIVAIVVLFAGAGLSYGYDNYRNKFHDSFRKGLVVVVIAAIFSNWHYLPRSHFSAFRYHVLGHAFAMNNQPLLAITYYEKSIDYEPRTIEVHLALGHLYLKQKEAAKAWPHLLYVLHSNSKNWITILSIAKELYIQHQYELAEKFFEKTLVLKPNLQEAEEYLKKLHQ